MDGGDLQLPPGFRFHPTDEELVMHYLCRKCAALPLAVPIVAEVDLYKYDPWRLPGMALYGEKEWYFFSPRDRKYPNGSRPNRAAGSGYWKATGADKPIGGPKPLGIKKALVFYAGKAPRGEKTNWIMHEYRLANVDRSARKKNSSLRLDDWVLCRIYNKKGSAQAEKLDRKTAGSKKLPPGPADTDQKPVFSSSPHVSAHPAHGPVQGLAELVHFDPSDSMPRGPADSCSSEHVLSTEFTSEVESQPRSRGEWERALEGPINNGNASGLIPSQIELAGPCEPWFRDPLQDIFMYLGKPF